jgi:hypothetical protein
MSERDAVLKSADQIFDLSGSDLGGGKLKRRLRGQRGMGGGEPSLHVLEIPFEQLESEADQPRKANQPIRLLRLESLGFFASGKRAGRNLKELGSPRRRKIEHCPEALEGLE